jgi:hypothetical protein
VENEDVEGIERKRAGKMPALRVVGVGGVDTTPWLESLG